MLANKGETLAAERPGGENTVGEMSGGETAAAERQASGFKTRSQSLDVSHFGDSLVHPDYSFPRFLSFSSLLSVLISRII